MRDDTPDDLVHDAVRRGAVPGPPARPRGARHRRRRSTAMTRDDIADVPRTRTTGPATSCVAAAGNLDHDEVVARRRAAASPASGGGAPRRARPPAPAARAGRGASTGRPSRRTSCSACAALARDDPDRYALAVVNQVLGGGMSSRLFQEVREKRGLAYSVYSYRAALRRHRLRSRSTPAPRPSASTRRSTVIDAELDRLVADGAARATSSTRPRATSRARSRCRSRPVEPHAPPRAQPS